MNTEEGVKPTKEKRRVPVTVTPLLISRADFRVKALKAYVENKRKRNLETLNSRRGSNLLSDSSDEETELIIAVSL